MADEDQSLDRVAQSLTTAQLEKLKIEFEIEKLELETDKLKSKKPERINLVAYTPLISVLIAVSGFLFGVFQYYKEQEKARINEQTDQRLKVQTQIRDDLTRILQFPKEKNLTLSQVAFLLNDIDRLLKVRIGGVDTTPESLQEDHRKITLNLTRLILDDCNFDEPRDGELGRVVLENWDDYKAYLKTDKDSLMNILIKYTDGLTNLHGIIPRYISEMKYGEDWTVFDEPVGASQSDKSHLRHFETLVRGFGRYLELGADDQKFKIDAVKDFQVATCNEALTKQEFGMSFDPRSDPVTFVDCLAKDRKK